MPSFVDLDGLRTFKEHLKLSEGIDTATSSVAGLTKLYDELGTATDGAVTQATVTKFVNAKRYGYRIKKAESEPYERVEYLFDAAAMTPAKMDFVNGVFDYGSWADVWFVKDNKPCMLDSDGTVAYYLNPNDYSLKEDGTASDITDTDTSLNAMAQIPLCWIKRYEDDEYFYEIVSNVRYDEDYKAYAHTDADDIIKPYFYTAMFGASGNATKLRSLSDQTAALMLTAQQQVTAATANGSDWYIGTWSQHELIRTLLVLISKSCDSQASFGNGNAQYPATAQKLLTTGTLSDKGQFFGYNDFTHQVKVFHV